MAWRNIKVEDQREYLIKSYISKFSTMEELCQELGISRKTGYKWLKRYIDGGLDALSDISRAPKEPFRKFSDKVIDIALAVKQRYPKYGPKKIYAILLREYPGEAWPSPTRLYEIFNEHHLVCSRKLRRRVPRTHPLGEINASNDVWCADFKGWFLTQDKTKVEPLTITDGYSRYLIKCQHLEKKDFSSVWKIYDEAFQEYGLPFRIRTDNGPPFATTGVGRLSRLAINLVKAGVLPEWINPGHPEENGRHERFHRSFKDAVASPPANSFSEQMMRMKAYIEEYNFERPHEALNQQVPGSYYQLSTRRWDGVLRSPEYNTQEMKLRKIGSSGCIHWKQKFCYLGQLLQGEYVGLREIDNGYHQIFYGPIFLGTLTEKNELNKP